MASLRDKQKALARAEILRATADLVTERSHLDFSVAEVAKAAGVSLRTVYNHFEDREALLNALAEQWDEEIRRRGGPQAPAMTSLDDIVDAVQVMFMINAELPGLADAFAKLEVSRAQDVDPTRPARTQAFVDLGQADLPHLNPTIARNVALLLRHIVSQRSWWSLTADYGLTDEDAGRITAWAVRTLVDAARDGVTLPPVPPRDLYRQEEDDDVER